MGASTSSGRTRRASAAAPRSSSVKAGFIDPSALPFQLHGRHIAYVSAFNATLTNYPTLYGNGGTQGGATGVSEDRVPSSDLPSEVDADTGSVDNSEGITPNDVASPATTVPDSTRSRSRIQFHRPRHLVFVFRISFMDGMFAWSLRKTVREFITLATDVRKSYGLFAPDFPHNVRILRAVRQHWGLHRRVIARRLRLFLSACLQLPRALEFVPLREFLELSSTTLDPREPHVRKEGYLQLSGDASEVGLSHPFACLATTVRSYVVLRDSYAVLLHTSTSAAADQVLLLDADFEVQPGIATAPAAAAATAAASDDANPTASSSAASCAPGNGSILRRLSRAYNRARYAHSFTMFFRTGRVVCRAPSRKHAEDWILALRTIRASSIYAHQQPHGSFAPAREGSASRIRWIVDAHNTYCAIVDALRSAKHEIFLTGWWITPDLAVIRNQPATNAAAEDEGAEKMLQVYLKEILAERARAGVKVYVLMWKEPPLTLALSSLYQKRLLRSLCPENIFVQRHGGLFWTHHEKLVVVDRRIAFVGGIDVCWGRWDTGGHMIVDPDRVFFPQGVEYYNPDVADWVNVTEVWQDRVDRRTHPRMAWHDVHSCMEGAAVQDVVRHFVQRWNHNRSATAKRAMPVLTPHAAVDDRTAQLMIALGPAATRTTTAANVDAVGSQGAPAVVPRLRSLLLAGIAMGRLAKPRNEIGTQTSPQPSPTAAASAAPAHAPPRLAGLVSQLLAQHARAASATPPSATSDWYCSRDWTVEMHDADVQVVRSVSKWSAGTQTESSIYHAYVHAILSAAKCIYIENQYFLSSLGWTQQELLDFEFSEGHLTHRGNGVAASASATAAQSDDEDEDDEEQHVASGRTPLHSEAASRAATPRTLPFSPRSSAADIHQAAGEVTRARQLWRTVRAWTHGSRPPADVAAPAAHTPTPPPVVPMDTVMEWHPARNSVAEALYVRLCRAIEARECFRVVVVLPVHPDGPIRTLRATQLVLHWQACTIARGGHSLLERLARRFPGVDLDEYITFCALRRFDRLGTRTVTQQVYVHSKVMVVDDRVVILGSANINDRSMYGDRDSEIALVIRGGQRCMTRMNGEPWEASVFAHTLRRNLWEEHLGVPHTCQTRGTLQPCTDNAHVPVCPIRKFNDTAEQAEAAQQQDTEVDSAHSVTCSAASLSAEATTVSAESLPLMHEVAARANAERQQRARTASAIDHRMLSSAAGVALDAPHESQPPSAAFAAAKSDAFARKASIVKAFETAAAASNGLGRVACMCDALIDPTHASVYHDIVRATANANTATFSHVFHGMIQDDIRTIKEWSERDAEEPVDVESLDAVVGNLICFPKMFLSGQDLRVQPSEKEFYLPQKIAQ